MTTQTCPACGKHTDSLSGHLENDHDPDDLPATGP